MTGREILDLPMQDNDSGASTIRGYLKELLAELWREQEGFSGKRPFGNSGWTWDMLIALGKAGLIHVDSVGITVEQISVGNQLIFDAIDALT